MKKILLLLLFISPFLIFGQTQIGQTLDGELPFDFFGTIDLSESGNTVIIGATGNDTNGEDSGQVRVYENQSGTWVQIGQDINGDAIGDNVGLVSISSDGSIIAVGATGSDSNGIDSGQIRVYENISGVWTQVGQDINGEGIDDASGSVSLSSDGNIIAIGATGNNDNGIDSGHVRVYENQSGTWVQIGQDIDGENSDDESGGTVQLSSDGTIVAISALSNSDNGELSGQIRVYENLSGVWTQIGQDINGDTAFDFLSFISLSADGNILATGASGGGANASLSGLVRVYENLSGVWTQIGQDINGENSGDGAGAVSLSSDGSVLAIGATSHGPFGHVRIFQNQSGTWNQVGEIDGNIENGGFGSSIVFSGDTKVIAIGASFVNNFAGQVRVFDLNEVLAVNNAIESSFSIYPNPASSIFTIQLNTGAQLEKVHIYNNLGQHVYTSRESTIPVSDLNKGVYYLEVITDQGKVSRKLIVE